MTMDTGQRAEDTVHCKLDTEHKTLVTGLRIV